MGTRTRIFVGVLALCLLVVTAGMVAADGGPDTGSTAEPTEASVDAATLETFDAADEDLVHECAETPPDDFADPPESNDAIGWVDGYWYNEPIDIDASDGLTRDELAELSARTAARFEAMRCLPFEEIPRVDVITREEFAEETADQYADVDEETRLYDNAQLATMLLIGTDEDSIDVRQQDRAATVGGYYNFNEKRIVVVSDNPDELLIDEQILAHELGHAVQDQHFDLAQYTRDTSDLDRGKLGIIEGDVHRIEHEYLQYCEQDLWTDECVTEPIDEEPEAPPNWGLYLKEFQPYSDGPSFAEYVYEEGGWDAVDAVYDDMPETAVEIIYPERYGEFEPADLDLEDRTGDEWERLQPDGGPGYNVIGQSGITAMFVEPAYDQSNPDEFISQQNFVNFDPVTGEIDPQNPLNFDQPESNGWAADELHVFRNEANETATIWKTAWEDDAEGDRFARTYDELVESRGGERVDGYAHTYEFDADTGFEMALTLVPEGDRVWIQTAPTVDDLTDVDTDLELVDADASRIAEQDDDGEEDDGADNGDDDDDPIPGFGVVAAVIASLVAGLGLARRLDRV